ncbi:MAG: bifunctional diguanylate cyclase/phosphodiesterase [Lachnospiraceae bacterium]|nr:bifunctional diguanylate cyclase/phosphodiesterase [Lachnospiraceae bacterium]
MANDINSDVHRQKEEKSQGRIYETIVFEYDIQSDVMNFSRNVAKFIPCQTRIMDFSESLELGGKVCPDDLKRAITFFRPMRYDSPGRREYFRCLDFDGVFQWYKVVGKTIMDENNRPALLYGTYSRIDIDDDDAGAEVRRMADELTGLDSRPEAELKISSFFAEQEQGTVYNLMLIELTDYDVLLKSAGHERADLAAVEVARIFKRSLRASDIIGRESEKRFLICMKGVKDRGIICDKASYIMRAVKAAWSNYRMTEETVINVGIAIYNGDGFPDYDSMRQHAGDALLHSKGNTPNSFSLYDGKLRGQEELAGTSVPLSDMELIRSILDPIMSLAYAVDENHRLLYMNDALRGEYPKEINGFCYEVLKGIHEPCKDCPINKMGRTQFSLDSDVYSPRLRTEIRTRTTRISLVNQRSAYVMADVRQDLAHEMQEIHRSMEHFNEAIYKSCDVIWEINLTRNSCARVREEGLMFVIESHIVPYEKLRKQYLDYVVYYMDREDFLYVTDPGYLRESRKIGREQVNKQVRFLNQDGSYHWYDINTVVKMDVEEGGDELVFLTARDINDLKIDLERNNVIENKYKAMRDNSAFMSELARENERYERINELTGCYVFEFDVAEQSYYICTTFEEMFMLNAEMQRDEWSLLEGMKPADEDREKYHEFLELVKNQPDTHSTTLRIQNRFGISRWFTITVQTLKGLNNLLTRITGIFQDVNTEMEIKAELEFRADYDSLTGLYNADAFYRLVQEKIHIDLDKNFAIISVDIEHFRIINDRFGVDTGNRCLKELGKVIRSNLPKGGIAGRYEADMFSLLLDYDNDHDILELIDSLTQSFDFEEAKRCGSTLSYGIYKIESRDIPIRLMCDRARLAKKEIKGNMLTNFAVYDDKIRIMQRKVAQMESEMQLALDRKEFVMYLQPKVDLKTEKICSAEALVRWKHPTGGLRFPGEFLPYFENNGFIMRLDEYMWECAAEYIAHLAKKDMAIPISVNVSRFHVTNPDLINVLTGLTKKYGIENKYLELEITETLFTEDVDQLYRLMEGLKRENFIIEMDDFGSGYSSLNMLREAPVDVIKIDRYFIDEIMSTRRGRVIIENSITMSKQLGLTVIAEGVETREQIEFLKKVDCDIAQGYYYSKPIPTEDFDKLLEGQ